MWSVQTLTLRATARSNPGVRSATVDGSDGSYTLLQLTAPSSGSGAAPTASLLVDIEGPAGLVPSDVLASVTAGSCKLATTPASQAGGANASFSYNCSGLPVGKTGVAFTATKGGERVALGTVRSTLYLV